MQRISVNVKNDCVGNQINYNNNLPANGNKNYALQKSFQTDFLTVIGNAKLQLFSSPRQPTTLWPKAPDFAV